MSHLIDMTDEEYFALPSLDQSQLKAFLNNPANWGYSRLHGTVKKTAALSFGTAFHAYLMNTGDVIAPPEGMKFTTKDGKAWKAEHEGTGEIVVSYDDMQTLKLMKQNIERSSLEGPIDFMDILASGYCEHVIEWVDKKSGLTLKAKPDCVPVGVDYIIDLKSTRSANDMEFAKEAWNYGYHIQAEFYRAAVAQVDPKEIGREERLASGMQFWAFEKTEACDWSPITISADNPMAEAARTSIRNGLTRMAECVEKGEDAGYGKGIDAAAEWCIRNGYSKTPHEAEFPDWIVKAAENLL
ncbi:PD-(D/E)XK nuclease-like domain-containing protein [Bifidobacterium callitrichidarum]|uniref:Nuclease n=1 Tax=Bifidobacterium callitrichidarum TaxID=2052941 RepID=A0A2U2N9C5_9BIFI|nr:PD-(D/E)XK nuclease-like domain-containing protein [Bifidobacterium callitrichidarum]PWG65682.1 nuclease [Bifidobacterium callitrichidarum]